MLNSEQLFTVEYFFWVTVLATIHYQNQYCLNKKTNLPISFLQHYLNNILQFIISNSQ